MTRYPHKKLLSEIWKEEYQTLGFCIICDNSGIIDTRDKVFAGYSIGRISFCICPNGRIMKKKGHKLE